MESYECYVLAQRGGPLFLAIVLEHLQKNSEEHCTKLAMKIHNMKITDYPSEDVLKVITLLHAVI
jgi:hypothetical protein